MVFVAVLNEALSGILLIMIVQYLSRSTCFLGSANSTPTTSLTAWKAVQAELEQA